MEEGIPFNILQSAVRLPVLSLLLFLVDVVLDVWAIVCFYKEQKYICMALLICILLSSSVLQQIFSWLWYNDLSKNLKTNVEEFISRPWVMNIVHVFQLGVFVRFASLIEISSIRFKWGEPLQALLKLNQNQDLSMLRLFEAFSESAPQLVLMVALTMEVPELQSFTVIKILASLSSISITMLSFHRFMLSHLFETFKMGRISSLIYFLWNLLLIGSRVVCVSLFASVLPCYVAPHFLFLWTLLVLWAWWQRTNFMDSTAGEWLYRATVGLIWYFSWFNVTSGKTTRKMIIYQGVMATDMTLLVGLWCWRRSLESARHHPLPVNPYLLLAMLASSYVIGILLKVVYYWKFHPKQQDLQWVEKESEYVPKMHFLMNSCKFLPKNPDLHIQVDVQDTNPEGRVKATLRSEGTEETDSSETQHLKPAPLLEGRTVSQGAYKRMRNTAMNFYF